MKYFVAALITLGVLFASGKPAFADAYSYTSIVDPSATGATVASGINNAGTVVGSFRKRVRDIRLRGVRRRVHHAQRHARRKRHLRLWNQ